MNILTLLYEYRSAVLEDPKIKAWCQRHYNKSLTVLIGSDDNNPPTEDDYPLIHLFPIEKEVGIKVDPKEHSIGCTCGVHNAEEAEKTYDNSKVMKGLVHLEEFRKLAETALVKANLDDIYISRIRIEYDTAEIFPFHLVGMEVTVEQERSFREDPFE